MMMLLLVFMVLVSVAQPQAVPVVNVWPLPRSVIVPPNPVLLPLSSSLEVSAPTSHSAALQAAVTRYAVLIRKQAADVMLANSSSGQIVSITVVTKSDDETLSFDTDYSYEVLQTADSVQITANSPFGGIYGLETVTQLINSSGFSFANISISDSPSYHHRGFMIDIGRRFWPVDLVKQTIDAMAAFKMNVLHLHLSDWARFGIQSALFPELTANLTGLQAGFYTPADVKDIVSYAAQRGIRSVPEIDIPGHDSGLYPLQAAGLQLCDSTKFIKDDSAGKTVEILQKLFNETAALFPDAMFHIGADEIGTSSDCPIDVLKSLEVKVLQFLADIGKIPVSWQESFLTTGASREVPSTVLVAWTSDNVIAQLIDSGHKVIQATSSHSYVNHAPTPAAEFWWDIGSGLNSTQQQSILGGHAAMWTDNYCYIPQCHSSGTPPVAHDLYGPDADPAFATSIHHMVWPRTALSAGSYWNYQPELLATSADFAVRYALMVDVLTSRNVTACPTNCFCDELTVTCH